MKHLRRALLSASLVLLSAACGVAPSEPTDDTNLGAANEEIRSISNAEALQDFDQIAASFEGLYGAMERKQQRYKFRFEELKRSYRARVRAAKKESEYLGIYQEFISRFQDAHVSLSAPLSSDATHSYSLPLLAMPVENTFVVYAVASSLSSKIQRGEELLSIDGVSAQNLIRRFAKYTGNPNPLAAAHFNAEMLTFRPNYASDDLSANKPAKLLFRRADGTTHEETLNWRQSANFLPAPPVPAPAPNAGESTPSNLTAASGTTAALLHAELTQFGTRVPFFMSQPVRTALKITEEVTPSEAALTKFGLTADDSKAINYFAVKYELGTKKVLLVRLPDYSPSDVNKALNYFAALIDEQQAQVDALVLDETHNPGGNISFAVNLVTLLTSKKANSLVQRMHGDRLWISAYANVANRVRSQSGNAQDPLGLLFDERARTIDAAYSANQSLSAPIPFFFDAPTIDPEPSIHWTKPLMVLADELSVSCADIVPAIVKANGLGKLFGQRTMGGGGNVETVATLTNTRATLALSRGVGTVFDPSGAYPEATIIEDNGVTPDVTYSHTLADFRAGYVGYVQAFNAELAKMIP